MNPQVFKFQTVLVLLVTWVSVSDLTILALYLHLGWPDRPVLEFSAHHTCDCLPAPAGTTAPAPTVTEIKLARDKEECVVLQASQCLENSESANAASVLCLDV